VTAPLLELRGVEMHFPRRSAFLNRTVGHVRAVDGVDLAIRRGETVGLVGESGSGKSTLGRIALGLLAPTAGEVLVEGAPLSTSSRDRLAVRSRLQFVFQDPYSSLDPFTPVGESVAEPLRTHGVVDGAAARRVRVAELLEQVGLRAAVAGRYPREFSGGQLQRIAIARALALEPELIVLDEPVSALDVSIQAGVVNLLERLQHDLGLAYVFIAHDLSIVRHISDRVAVMYLGKIVEEGPAAAIYERAGHPYTQALLSAVPLPDPRREKARTRILLRGDVPSPADPPSGCRFRTRCFHKLALEEAGVDTTACVEQEPALEPRNIGHPTACHFAQMREVV
jgi:oligopeptide transport system ATP-binding protein